jgi:hypothetical protein
MKWKDHAKTIAKDLKWKLAVPSEPLLFFFNTLLESLPELHGRISRSDSDRDRTRARCGNTERTRKKPPKLLRPYHHPTHGGKIPQLVFCFLDRFFSMMMFVSFHSSPRPFTTCSSSETVSSPPIPPPLSLPAYPLILSFPLARCLRDVDLCWCLCVRCRFRCRCVQLLGFLEPWSTTTHPSPLDYFAHMFIQKQWKDIRHKYVQEGDSE